MSPSRRLRVLAYKRALTRWWAMAGIGIWIASFMLFITGWGGHILNHPALPSVVRELFRYLPFLGILAVSLSAGLQFQALARRRLCPKCLYPVEAESAPMPEVCICPECGFTFRRSDYDEAFRGVHPQRRPPLENE